MLYLHTKPDWGGLLPTYEANRDIPCVLDAFYSFWALGIWPAIPSVSLTFGHAFGLFYSPTFEEKYALIGFHNSGFLNIAHQSVSSAQDPGYELFLGGNIPKFGLP